MNWVFALAGLGLVGMLVEMLVSYLRDANEIRGERTQKEQLIQAHQHTIEQAKSATEETSSRLSDLEVTSRDVKRMWSEAQKQLKTVRCRVLQRRMPPLCMEEGGTAGQTLHKLRVIEGRSVRLVAHVPVVPHLRHFHIHAGRGSAVTDEPPPVASPRRVS